MKDELKAGLGSAQTHTITAEMVTFHMEKPALSTPSMIGLIEGTCHHAVLDLLDETETTVGTHINVSHQAASFEGESATVTCTLAEVRRRRLLFDVTVLVGDRVISTGHHERYVLAQE